MRSEEEKKEQKRKAQKKYYEKHKEYYRKQSLEESKRVRKERNLYKEIIKEVRDKTIQMIANNSLDFMYRQAYKDILEIIDYLEEKDNV